MNSPSNLTAWERWELASFAPDVLSQPTEPPPQEIEDESQPIEPIRLPTAEEVEQIYQQAREEGYKRGLDEGHQTGLEQGLKLGETTIAAEAAKVTAEAEKLAEAASKLDIGLTTLDTAVADELLALALAIAREVVRQEISARPETLLLAVREAIIQLPHQHAAIYLHPDDASLLRSYMGDQLAHAGHRIHEDFKLQRGDCVLEAGGSQLDASVAMRWRRVVENLGLSSAWQVEEVSAADSHDES